MVGLAACGSGSDSADPPGATGSKKSEVRIVLALALTGNTFHQIVADGGKDAAAARSGVKLDIIGPAAPDPQNAIKEFQDVLRTKPDGVAVQPLPAELWIRPIKEALDKTILIGHNVGPDPAAGLKTYVGINEFEGTQLIVDKVVEELGSDAKGEIVLGNCIPGVAPLDSRIDAYKAELGKAMPNVTIDGPFETTTEPTKSYGTWVSIVKSHPGALAFLGNCDTDGTSLAKVKKEVPGDYVTATYDINPEALQAIKAGDMLAALDEAPYLRGVYSVGLLADAAQGIRPMPEGFVDIPGLLVTADNIDEVLAKEESPATQKAYYADRIKEFFADPQAQIRPIEDLYAKTVK